MNNCLLTPKSKQPKCPDAPKKPFNTTRLNENSLRTVCRVLFTDEPKPLNTETVWFNYISVNCINGIKINNKINGFEEQKH